MEQRSDDRPKHERIAAEIRARIMAGDLPPGEQLPSTPNLVSQYGAANATIQRALAALKEEGFLVRQAGKGVYMRDRQPLAVHATAYLTPGPAGYQYRILDETHPA